MNVLRHVNAINMGVCILIWVIGCANAKVLKRGNDSNLLIVFYVQIMPDDFVMQLHRF